MTCVSSRPMTLEMHRGESSCADDAVVESAFTQQSPVHQPSPAASPSVSSHSSYPPSQVDLQLSLFCFIRCMLSSSASSCGAETGCLQLLEILEISRNFVDAPGKIYN